MRHHVVLAALLLLPGGHATTDAYSAAVEEACSQDVGAIRIPPPLGPTGASGGPAPEIITVGRGDAASFRAPWFPDEADGLPFRGGVRQGGGQAAYYGAVSVSGLTLEEFVADGGLLLTSGSPDARELRLLDRLPPGLPQVRVGRARGWVNQDVQNTSGQVRGYVVVWILPDGSGQMLSGNRAPEELVALARSITCVGVAGR